MIVDTPVPHFTLDNDLVDAFTSDEAFATITALQECGVLSLPYDCQTITADATRYMSSGGWRGAKSVEDYGPLLVTYAARNPFAVRLPGRLVDVSLSATVYVARAGEGYYLDRKTGMTTLGHHLPQDVLDPLLIMMLEMTGLLITALNTKNVVKTTQVNKRIAKGKPSKGQFKTGSTIHLSCTRLSLPRQGGAGTSPRMHLRRGHVHHFRTGRNWEGPLVAKFVPAMLVNKDEFTGTVTPPSYEVAP